MPPCTVSPKDATHNDAIPVYDVSSFLARSVEKQRRLEKQKSPDLRLKAILKSAIRRACAEIGKEQRLKRLRQSVKKCDVEVFPLSKELETVSSQSRDDLFDHSLDMDMRDENTSSAAKRSVPDDEWSDVPAKRVRTDHGREWTEWVEKGRLEDEACPQKDVLGLDKFFEGVKNVRIDYVC